MCRHRTLKLLFMATFFCVVCHTFFWPKQFSFNKDEVFALHEECANMKTAAQTILFSYDEHGQSTDTYSVVQTKWAKEREREKRNEPGAQSISTCYEKLTWMLSVSSWKMQVKRFLFCRLSIAPVMLCSKILLYLLYVRVCDAICSIIFTIDSRLEVPNSCATCNSLSNDIDKLFGTELDNDFTSKSEFDSALFLRVLPSNCILALSLSNGFKLRESEIEWSCKYANHFHPSSFWMFQTWASFFFVQFSSATSIRLNGSEPKPKL